MDPRTYSQTSTRRIANAEAVRPSDSAGAALQPQSPPVSTFFRAPSFEIAVKGSRLCVRVSASSTPSERHVG